MWHMIAIIAGNGTLPRVVASKIVEKEEKFAIFCLETENWLFFNNSPFIKKAKHLVKNVLFIIIKQKVIANIIL